MRRKREIKLNIELFITSVRHHVYKIGTTKMAGYETSLHRIGSGSRLNESRILLHTASSTGLTVYIEVISTAQ